MKELPITNLDVVTSGSRSNIRFSNGIQVEYGYIGFEVGVDGREFDYIRPFVNDLTVGIAGWRFANEKVGFASYTEMSNTKGRIDCWGKDTGNNQFRSISYIVIGRWK